MNNQLLSLKKIINDLADEIFIGDVTIPTDKFGSIVSQRVKEQTGISMSFELGINEHFEGTIEDIFFTEIDSTPSKYEMPNSEIVKYLELAFSCGLVGTVNNNTILSMEDLLKWGVKRELLNNSKTDLVARLERLGIRY